MIKIKLLAVLLMALALLAMSAGPADAWFKSGNPTKTTGSVKFGKISFTFSFDKITCASATGEWSIQTKGQFKDHEKAGKQVKTTFGPDLYVKMRNWNQCKGEQPDVISPVVTIEDCSFQFQQEQKNTGSANALLSVVTECEVYLNFLFCADRLTPGNEQTGVNAFLKQIKSEQSGQNVLTTANVENIHTKGCQEVTNGTFESEERSLIEEGLELA
jgi:hypothetical protein